MFVPPISIDILSNIFQKFCFCFKEIFEFKIEFIDNIFEEFFSSEAVVFR